jgi:hypothetical protein
VSSTLGQPHTKCNKRTASLTLQNGIFSAIIMEFDLFYLKITAIGHIQQNAHIIIQNAKDWRR